MLKDFNDWGRGNVECCACGDKLGKTSFVTIIELKKVATWKFPVFGRIDVPGYEPRALAMVCDKCIVNKEKILRCVEWEGPGSQIKYHDVAGLKDATKSVSQMDYYFGRLFRLRMLERKAARQECEN